jgi:hypothetical protein
MQSKTLEKTAWQSALDGISKIDSNVLASIIVSGQDIGVQTETDETPFLGISYDPHDDAVFVETEGLNHRIARPSEIILAHEEANLLSIGIVAGDIRHIVSFKPPLGLSDIGQF